MPSKSVMMASCLFFSFCKLLDFSSSSDKFVENSEILSSNSFFSWRSNKKFTHQQRDYGYFKVYDIQLIRRIQNVRTMPNCSGDTLVSGLKDANIGVIQASC